MKTNETLIKEYLTGKGVTADNFKFTKKHVIDLMNAAREVEVDEYIGILGNIKKQVTNTVEKVTESITDISTAIGYCICPNEDRIPEGSDCTNCGKEIP